MSVYCIQNKQKLPLPHHVLQLHLLPMLGAQYQQRDKQSYLVFGSKVGTVEYVRCSTTYGHGPPCTDDGSDDISILLSVFPPVTWCIEELKLAVWPPWQQQEHKAIVYIENFWAHCQLNRSDFWRILGITVWRTLVLQENRVELSCQGLTAIIAVSI